MSFSLIGGHDPLARGYLSFLHFLSRTYWLPTLRGRSLGYRHRNTTNSEKTYIIYRGFKSEWASRAYCSHRVLSSVLPEITWGNLLELNENSPTYADLVERLKSNDPNAGNQQKYAAAGFVKTLVNCINAIKGKRKRNVGYDANTLWKCSSATHKRASRATLGKKKSSFFVWCEIDSTTIGSKAIPPPIDWLSQAGTSTDCKIRQIDAAYLFASDWLVQSSWAKGFIYFTSKNWRLKLTRSGSTWSLSPDKNQSDWWHTAWTTSLATCFSLVVEWFFLLVPPASLFCRGRKTLLLGASEVPPGPSALTRTKATGDILLAQPVLQHVFLLLLNDFFSSYHLHPFLEGGEKHCF